ncbi:MAG: hypothetical protein N4A53_08060 [Pelagimonas sp.]|jgi:hypothetical protein|nr:hypothetical protein [Pelagimonas sp.]
MRKSLNSRLAAHDPFTDELRIMLMQFEHPDLPAPIRLSTDPTERLSADPLSYGTRSTWMGADTPFLFVLASWETLSDFEDAPRSARIVIENVDSAIATLLRSVSTRPRAHIAEVLASSPDQIELEARGLYLQAANGNAGEVPLILTRDPIELETVPMDRFTKNRFPGLFR